MKTLLQVSTILLSVKALGFSDSIVCFTQNVPERAGSIFFADSEIYLSKEALLEEYTIKIVTNKQVVVGPTLCQLEPVIGYGTHLLCGDEKVSLDMSNNSGHILRFSSEFNSYSEQRLVCRDKAQLLQ